MPAARGWTTSRPGSSDRSRRASSFLSFRFRCFWSIVISVLLGENWDLVRPGDERFINLPNGVEGPLQRGPCHHASDRQYRSHACERAKSTSEVSALACRIESCIRFARMGNSRQVSGASDASKMQSKLVTQNLSQAIEQQPLHYLTRSVRRRAATSKRGNRRSGTRRESNRANGRFRDITGQS